MSEEVMIPKSYHDKVCEEIIRFKNKQFYDAVHLLDDGTLEITVEDYTKVKRVLVEDDNNWGNLFYEDGADRPSNPHYITYINALKNRIKELEADRPQGEMIDISQEDFGTLCVCALRYCHGRQTYMPSLIQQIVTAHFKDLSDRDLQVIADDRQYQANMGLWGDDCDKADWDRFYRALLKCQKERSR